MKNTNAKAVFFCGDYSTFGNESEKAFKAGKNWFPKALCSKVMSRDVNNVLAEPVSETMLENSLGVFVLAPLWLGDEKGCEYVGVAKESSNEKSLTA